MATYTILSRVSSSELCRVEDFQKLTAATAERISRECPAVNWKDSTCTLGSFDTIDVVESADRLQLAHAADILREFVAESHFVAADFVERYSTQPELAAIA